MKDEKQHPLLARFILHPSSFILWATLVAALLRFPFLSQPALWGDEAKVFMRACGTFQQLVDALASTDFSPLHYLLYWSIAQVTTLTPTVMRLPPAIAGTLMVPAMYWIAVQVASKPAARLVAIFTACSAFMLNYSRDAKMYQLCWLFVALSIASLLWFVRERSRIAWYCWVIFSIAMVGLQAVAAIVLPLQLLLLLSHRRLNWKSAVFFGVGLALIITPLVTYTKYFNRYADRMEDGRMSSGTQWVEQYNRGRDGKDLLRFTATAFLYNWEWPRAVDERWINPQALKYLKLTGYILLPALIFGLYPYRKNRTSLPSPGTPGEGWVRVPVGKDAGGRMKDEAEFSVQPSFFIPQPAGQNPLLDPLPAYRERRPQREESDAIDPWWRTLLWISASLVLPAYAFYCASLRSRLSPSEMLDPVLHNPSPTLACLFAASIAFYFCDSTWERRFIKLFQLLSIFAILFGLCTLIHRFTPVQPGSVWMPRYLGVIWPAFAIAVCVLLMRLPTRPIRYAAIAFLLAINLIQHGARIFVQGEPPTALMAADAIEGRAIDSPTRLYNRIPSSPLGEPGTGVLGTHPARYYLAIQSGKPITPAEMRTTAWENDFRIFNLFRAFNSDSTIAQNVKGSPQLKQVIVWDRIEIGTDASPDPLAPLLQPAWKRSSESVYTARDHWTWKDLYQLRRRTYEKSE